MKGSEYVMTKPCLRWHEFLSCEFPDGHKGICSLIYTPPTFASGYDKLLIGEEEGRVTRFRKLLNSLPDSPIKVGPDTDIGEMLKKCPNLYDDLLFWALGGGLISEEEFEECMNAGGCGGSRLEETK